MRFFVTLDRENHVGRRVFLRGRQLQLDAHDARRASVLGQRSWPGRRQVHTQSPRGQIDLIPRDPGMFLGISRRQDVLVVQRAATPSRARRRPRPRRSTVHPARTQRTGSGVSRARPSNTIRLLAWHSAWPAPQVRIWYVQSPTQHISGDNMSDRLLASSGRYSDVAGARCARSTCRTHVD